MLRKNSNTAPQDQLTRKGNAWQEPGYLSPSCAVISGFQQFYSPISLVLQRFGASILGYTEKKNLDFLCMERNGPLSLTLMLGSTTELYKLPMWSCCIIILLGTCKHTIGVFEMQPDTVCRHAPPLPCHKRCLSKK